MRSFARLSVLGGALLAVLAGAEIASAAGRKPNILVIVGDDMGYSDVGFQGCSDIPTPRLDALARSGVRFTNGYVSGPYCSPTRAGLLTGRYQTRFGHEFNPTGGEDATENGLPLTEITLADRLKGAGYATGLVGKWHLGGAPKYSPVKRGFDEFFGFLGGAHPYFPGQGVPLRRGTEPIKESEYLTDAFAREAVSYIRRHKDHPFFLYLAFNAVHTPMHADDARLARFKGIADTRRRTYAAMMVAMDEAIGRVLDELRESKLEEETLIFFHSDNGGPVMQGTTVNGSINKPLRGSKRTTLEGGIRVPFVASWKGVIPAGKTYDAPVIQLDILPTTLAAAGAPTNDPKLDGVDLLPYLKGEKTGAPHETLYWRFGSQAAIRRGDWKLVRYDLGADGPPPAAAKKKRASRVSPLRLYNLSEDLGETTDLASKHPEKFKELLDAWKAWDSTLVKPLWGGGNAPE